MLHKPIKKYTQSGEIRDDSAFPRLRAELERLMIQQMKDEGYLPVYELGTFWSTKLLDKKYSFVLTIYASYAGKVKAMKYNYWQNGRLV
jgi:hypothetical protein